MLVTIQKQPIATVRAGHNYLLELADDWSFGLTVTHFPEFIYDIPKGYTFEASIPWLFRGIIGQPTDPLFWAAACAHDWAFETHCLGFEEANEIFFEMLKISGVPKWKRWAMKTAVSSRFAYEAYLDVPEASRQELKKLCDRPDGEKFKRWVYSCTLD